MTTIQPPGLEPGATPLADSLHCRTCNARRSCTPEQVAYYQVQGWPECCGEAMALAPERRRAERVEFGRRGP